MTISSERQSVPSKLSSKTSNTSLVEAYYPDELLSAGNIAMTVAPVIITIRPMTCIICSFSPKMKKEAALTNMPLVGTSTPPMPAFKLF